MRSIYLQMKVAPRVLLILFGQFSLSAALLFQFISKNYFYIYSMRVISTILVFILSAVTVFPCTDGDACVDEIRSAATLKNADHHHLADGIDMCSPLCVCSCCSHITQAFQINFDFTFHRPSEINFTLIDISVKSIYQSIWQPPRLL
jgi:hypothetical protein